MRVFAINKIYILYMIRLKQVFAMFGLHYIRVIST